MGGKILRLEALRGLAALYVVIHHTVPSSISISGINVGILTRFGQEAVILFFLLSGFVINYTFRISKDRSFKTYFYKRFFRIYIPLAFVFLISYLNSSYNAGGWLNPELKTLVLNLFMLQDWSFAKPLVIVDAYMENGPLWSLSYEWWFYMLYFPLFTYIQNRSTRDILVFLISIGSALVYLVYPAFPLRILMYLTIWWLGVRLADNYIDGRLKNIRALLLPLTAMILMIATLFAGVYLKKQSGYPITLGKHPLLELRHFIFALIAFVSALVLNKFGWRLFDLLIKPFLVLAPISYVIYIVHWPLATRGEYLDFINNDALRWFGYVATVLVVSYLIERIAYPYLRRKLWSRIVIP